MGDANADWLAYGLEDTYSEKPEIGIIRKTRTDSGLISYDARRDTEWPHVAREIIAAEKPKFIVMMIGNNDRQTIREKVPPPPPPSRAPKANAPAPSAMPGGPPVQPDPEQQPPEAAERHPKMTPEQARQAAYGPWEFHSEKWELAYIKRIDVTIAALKSAGVPVIWVGLASQRGTKSSQELSYLNELYRSRADKAGIIYVDIWDGFVDEFGPLLAARSRLRRPDSVGSAPGMASISPSSAPASLRTMWSAKSIASWATRVSRSRCRSHSIPPRSRRPPSRAVLLSGQQRDQSCRLRARALPRKNCLAAASSLRPRTLPSFARSQRASRSRRGVGEPTISAGRAAPSMSSWGRLSRRRPMRRSQM